jgi:hypothetical protein
MMNYFIMIVIHYMIRVPLENKNLCVLLCLLWFKIFYHNRHIDH